MGVDLLRKQACQLCGISRLALARMSTCASCAGGIGWPRMVEFSGASPDEERGEGRTKRTWARLRTKQFQVGCVLGVGEGRVLKMCRRVSAKYSQISNSLRSRAVQYKS